MLQEPVYASSSCLQPVCEASVAPWWFLCSHHGRFQKASSSLRWQQEEEGKGFAGLYCDLRPGELAPRSASGPYTRLQKMPVAHLGGFSSSLGVALKPLWDVSEAHQEPPEAAGGGRERFAGLHCDLRPGRTRTQECFRTCICGLPAAHLGVALQPPWEVSETQQEPPQAAGGGREGLRLL